MKCCAGCFRDSFIKKAILGRGKRGICNFCGGNKTVCITPAELIRYIQPIVDLYTPADEISKNRHIKLGKAKYIWDHLGDDFNLFANGANRKRLTKDIFKGEASKDDTRAFFSNKVAIIGGDISELYEDRIKIWKQLSNEIKFENRFFFKKGIPLKMMENLLPTFSIEIKEKSIFYRARVCDGDKFFDISKMGAPPPDKAGGGRANPPGIPYLYLADNANIAIYEVKPAIKDYISVGKFITTKKLNCIDLRDISPVQFYREEDYEKAVKYTGLFREISKQLTASVNHKLKHFEYVPTQFFCELVKSFLYDGVMYGSSCGDGYNLIIFDVGGATCKQVNNFQAVEIKHHCQKIN